MGTLRKYELKTADCKVFFETGTGLGHSLLHALDNGNLTYFIAPKFMMPQPIGQRSFLKRIKMLKYSI